jgi:hypothetical protein
LPNSVLVDFREQVAQFDDFIANNELGLALDILEEIVEESNCAAPPILQSMRLAAKNMERD